MKRNSRLSLALHTLGHMADDFEKLRTSAEIADHAGTNPVVVRRVLGRLREVGLLVAHKGQAGGWRLARPPQEITLADVYVALEEKLVTSGPEDELPTCSLEYTLHQRVSDLLQDLERDLVKKLAETSIADLSGKA